ncbi:preprotein translocase subunit SecY [Pelagibacterales bacterium]|nr:preprotein translocase subunit SecY [Pelagibacterales bacterium]MDA9373197.1 preprotein translocase subunit SecY [Pelagibacterales bacterium]MDB9818769.1 preprotein translocase subunit SecY [Pelagibacterales bacterium]MDB9986436.1 preprotein translocase subunit SecY [Pelagibacterales bacterium]
MFRKATELKKRIWFTLGILIVYRFGTYIPLSGIDIEQLASLVETNQSGILGMFDVFAGGAISRMAIFALGIMPYISASIIIQLMTSVSPALANLKKEGEPGRKKITQYTRYGTVILAILQGYGISVGLESAGQIVTDPGLFFRISTTITLVGGTVFLMWLGEQVTSRGIGNGISLIIFSGIVAEIPSALINTLTLGRQGTISTLTLLLLFALVIAVVIFIIFMERAQRRLLVQYPKRQMGNKMMGGDTSHLPLKLNTAGVIPAIFASSILLLPITIANFNLSTDQSWLSDIAALLGRGQPLYMALYASAIIFFAFFYTSIVFNPVETADNLKRNGGFIPGIRPGEKTAEYIDFVLSRITTIGALYLAFVCILPEILIAQYSIPFYLGGTSLLIVVVVGMDTVGQIQSHLFAYQYEGLIKKSRIRGRKK